MLSTRKNKKKTILFLTKGEHAASTRYRSLNYFPFLQNIGWQPCHLTATNTLPARIAILWKARRYDVVVILRKTFSSFFAILLRLCSKRLVFDFDDAIFCNSDGSPSKQRAKRFKKMVGHCDQIWAGNSYLAKKSMHYNSSVIILPTSLSPEKYLINPSKNNDFLDIVWIGSSSTKRYLESVLDLFESTIESVPNLRLKIVADFDLKTQRLPTLSIPWSQTKEAEALASSHIGIAPMSNDSWTKGKCGLKVLQYMVAGLPVISSPAGVNKDIVEHGTNGFLAEGPADWIDAMKKLSCNPQLRQKMGEAGRKKVLNHYSIEATFKKMSNGLDQLL